MIESIVAITALTICFTGVFSLLSTSLHSNRIVSDSSIATYLAAEGIEVVKNILDSTTIAGVPWGTGISTGDYEVDYASTVLMPNNSRTLSFDTTANTYDYSGFGTPTNFQRKIRITVLSSEEIAVNSIVSWNTGLAQSRINVEDHFMNWRP